MGLDPDPDLMPKVGFLEFNKAIIDATSDLVCAYKPNLAFYEALGMDGLKLLQKTIEHIPRHIPIIGDGKRGDIGSTAKAYAKSLFLILGFDAATVNPYLGGDAIEPFLEYKGKAIFILCRTSNPGAVDFQNITNTNGQPLYEIVAHKANEWNRHGNIGLVVGATYPDELKTIRSICPQMPILIPGIGAQGGDLPKTIHAGIDSSGQNAIINVSRQVIYASRRGDFAEGARYNAEKLRDWINKLIAKSNNTRKE